MLRRLRFKPPVLIGMSIQPENIHVVQLKKAKKTYLLEKAERYALPAEVFAEGKIVAFELLQSHVAEVVRAQGLQALQAAVALPANQVKMQRMTVPDGLTDEDIQAEITAQVGRYHAGAKESLHVDFQVSRATNTGESDVFYAAARSEYVQRYEACLRGAGLSLTTLDVDVFALLRAVRHALKFMLTDQEKVAALYFGQDYGVMAAQHGKEMLFHQQWDGQSTSQLAMTVMQWVEWCCHTYGQVGITSLAIGGRQEFVCQAAKIISEKWSCKIFETDPFSQMISLDKSTQQIANQDRSPFLLACGLAMREPERWLR
jgi:type IV pilus assembly protein PilM